MLKGVSITALGYLFILFAAIAILAVFGTALLFMVKKPAINDILLVIMGVFAVVIAYLTATSLPSNFIAQQVVA